jgi:DNA-binding NarL/FixJ family response regulator
MLSIYSAPEYRSAAAAAGASAYVPKNAMHIELVPTLRTLLNANGVG